ncbi:MAG: hypothetical protein AAGB15_13225, partial [Pseudomonadota bacterium]
DFTKLAKPWDGLIASITGSAADPEASLTEDNPAVSIATTLSDAPEHDTPRYDRAVTNIVAYLGRKGFTRVSFQRLEKEFGYPEAFVRDMIRERPGTFQTAFLKDRKSGEELKGLKRL